MRVIGSTAKKPLLRNVSIEEINSFRNQVKVVNMIGCCDDSLIVDKIKELGQLAIPKTEKLKHLPIIQEVKTTVANTSCGCSSCDDGCQEEVMREVEVVQANEPKNIVMDKAGYFVILPIAEKNIISVEHYSYDNTLLRIIEGKDARSIYWTIVENKWVTFLSHAAYLGKELTKAELSLKNEFKYVQDGA